MNHYTLHDGIAVITLDHPPLNSLSHALRSFIVRSLDAAQAGQPIPVVVNGNYVKLYTQRHRCYT